MGLDLPLVVKDPLVDLLGQKCYTALLEDLQPTLECCKVVVNKGLNLGLVFGGGVVKIPQILTILRAGSARGLSFASYLLDTVSLVITIAYCQRSNLPLLSYGENVLLLGQNAIVSALIIALGTTRARTQTSNSTRIISIVALFAGIIGFLYALLEPSIVSDAWLSHMMAASIPISVSSKLPQIWSNLQARSTGQLSAILVLASFAGCVARVYTTIIATDDKALLAGFVLNAILNGILVLQVLMYSSSERAKPVTLSSIPLSEKPAVVSQTQTAIRPPGVSPANSRRVVSNRQWVRRTD